MKYKAQSPYIKFYELQTINKLFVPTVLNIYVCVRERETTEQMDTKYRTSLSREKARDKYQVSTDT